MGLDERGCSLTTDAAPWARTILSGVSLSPCRVDLDVCIVYDGGDADSD